jgi:Dyp-type peroxidase family
MTPLFLKSNPIQGGEVQNYQAALQSTQGNILKSHGRHFTSNVFLSFKGNAESLKAAIREFAPSVTSAAAQAQQTAGHKRESAESIFVGFGLAAEGYRQLGCDPDKLQSPEFSGGMTRPGSPLLDPPVSEWEAPFQKPIHAMVLLAHKDLSELTKQTNALLAPFAGLADPWTESGSKILKGKETLEQFGFVDGVSQPIFFQSDIGGSTANWDPGAGTNLVLVKDPFGKSDDDCGSFYVFRKLKQHVAEFKKSEALFQAQLTKGQNAELAGALVVGRFRDGTPVVSYQSRQGNTENDFIYVGPLAPAISTGADPFDQHCPISAHIRKVNPRGGTGDIATERNRRIARRGITYGDAAKDADAGLLFQCCQSNLQNQFEFLQGTWSNTPGKPSNTGTDPIAAQSTAQSQSWPSLWGSGNKITFDFGGFVKLQGGAYFFLPSITSLTNM